MSTATQNNGKVPWQIRSLTPKYLRIMELLSAGMSQKDIAAAVGMTPIAVGLIVRSPLFQQALAEVNGEIQERAIEALVEPTAELAKLAGAATVVLANRIYDDEMPELQLRAAKDVLDRTGHRAPKELVVYSLRVDGKFKDDVLKALQDEGTTLESVAAVGPPHREDESEVA